jgi:putative transposase
LAGQPITFTCSSHSPQPSTRAEAVQRIKGSSSRWIHDTFPVHENFEWQEGYGAFSIGISGIEDTLRYISEQAVHHRTRSYEEEFIAFLTRHEIEYDERYIWG